MFWPFLLAAVVLVIVPGPDMILIVTLGSQHGRKAGLAAAAGVAAGLAVHVTIAVLGLAALLHRFPAVYQVLKWVGVAYLVYLAISSYRARSEPLSGDGAAVSAPGNAVLSAFRSAAITNVLNPKVILFNVAFLPQFANPDLGRVPLQLAILGLVLVVVDFAIDGPIGYFAGVFGSRVVGANQNVNRRINAGAGAIFLGLAGWLAVS
ncbi:LysE family translocator [Nocardia sp. NPDC048505]|uniref:LysE family translocator n=1 Tax=unclassified Nocardia TaxID=2637762 RepID=UPI0033EEF111